MSPATLRISILAVGRALEVAERVFTNFDGRRARKAEALAKATGKRLTKLHAEHEQLRAEAYRAETRLRETRWALAELERAAGAEDRDAAEMAAP